MTSITSFSPPADQIAFLITQNRGNVAAIADLYEVSRTVMENYIQSVPQLKQALADAREEMLDRAEAVLYEKVIQGDTSSLHFYLRTQGRRRGYTESRLNINLSKIDMNKLTDSQLQRITDGENPVEVILADYISE
jgi:hypothetical protein